MCLLNLVVNVLFLNAILFLLCISKKVNKGLHWSLCVVVNPGAITSHLENLKERLGPLEESVLDSPFPCLLFLDALKMHNMKTVGRHIRKWLNAEWTRFYPAGEKGNNTPFNVKTMLITSPQVPRQTNFFDCGVFVCRYCYGLLCIRARTFSYREAGIKNLPPICITPTSHCSKRASPKTRPLISIWTIFIAYVKK